MDIMCIFIVQGEGTPEKEKNMHKFIYFHQTSCTVCVCVTFPIYQLFLKEVLPVLEVGWYLYPYAVLLLLHFSQAAGTFMPSPYQVLSVIHNVPEDFT